MTLNRIIIIFGIVLVLFAGIIFYQLNAQNIKQAFQSLPKTDVTIDNHIFHVEIAKTQKDQELGLSDRKKLDTDAGMLFLFDKADYHTFWMHNMQFPLDIIFMKDNKIVAIYSDVPSLPKGQSGAIYGNDMLSDKVLEINAGLAKKYFFNKGDSVKVNL